MLQVNSRSHVFGPIPADDRKCAPCIPDTQGKQQQKQKRYSPGDLFSKAHGSGFDLINTKIRNNLFDDCN
jgi:hypothetical protein